MKTTSLRAKALACALLAGTALSGLAAQPAAAQVNSPTFRNLDSNGVDLVLGDFLTSFPEGSIGSGEAELALLRMVGATGGSGNPSGSQWDQIRFSSGTAGTVVQFGPRKDQFPGAESRGATLSGTGNSRQYRAPDGTVIAFTDPKAGQADITNFCTAGGTQTSCILVPTSIASPDGKTVTLQYEFWATCVPRNSRDDPVNCHYTPRLARVSNSFGYSVQFAYALATPPLSSSLNPPATFYERSGASFRNSVAGTAALASVGYAYPAAGITDLTDTGGRVWRVTSGPTAYAVRRPGAAADTLGATLSNGIVTSVVNEGLTTNYSRIVNGNSATMTITQVVPGGTSPVSTIISDLTIGRPTSVTDPLSRTTGYQYDTSARLKRVTRHEGNYVEHLYDARGNVTQTVAVPKGGAGPTILTSASFDSTCANPVTCNQPSSVTDERGNTTDFTYDPVHGGVLTVTAPAPIPGAVRPQTRYSYTLVSGEYRLTGISQCQTASACAGTPDEVKTAFAYDSNGNVTSTSSGDGSGALTATSVMTYDPVGNLLTVDGPLPGTADTSRIRYNSARQVEGGVSPDPDGGGPLKHRAVRNSYANGLPTKVEQGNVNGQSDSDWPGFVPAQSAETLYDANARPVISKLVAGSTVYALTQTSYDALGRPECTAQRMNIAAFGSLPASACSLGSQGSDGPDRVAKTVYDLAGQVTQAKSALGTADEASEATFTYTPNGLVETVTDAENNKTTYEYDGHDRLATTRFPLPAKGATASAPASGPGADFEQLTYESLAGGARTSGVVRTFLNRAGQTIVFTTDALGRLTLVDLPNTFYAELDRSFSYDLLGRMTGWATLGYTSGSFTWDALGRKLADSTAVGHVVSQYDLAGRRTRLTWPDGFFVDYDYLVTGETVAIREAGSTSGQAVLAVFGYDDLGRRTSLAYGNGTSANYQYDPVSRLTRLKQDLTGPITTYDLTLDFAYNPAGQIASTTRSNDLYAWTGHGSGTTSTTADGLNRIAGWNGTLAHDARGNITAIGAKGYGYTADNQLTQGVGSSMIYDGAGRLASYSDPATAAQTGIVYDGMDAIAEYAGPTVVRRFVHGPGVDEPLVEYLGYESSFRNFLHADERGSIVGRSDSNGNSSGLNRYDEYGAHQGTLSGRYGYTGQMWLPAVGLYNYKARLRDPSLDRFMQTDPIGYGDGMNLYAYAGGDPVNRIDPSGLTAMCNNPWGGRAPVPCPSTQKTQTGTSSGNNGASSSGRGSGSRGATTGQVFYDDDIIITGIREDDILITGNRDSDVISPAPISLICWTPLECAQDLKESILKLRAKPKQPHIGKRAKEFASAAGFAQGPQDSVASLRNFDPRKTAQNIIDAGFTQQDVYDWAVFYSITHEMKRSNLTAFVRTEQLRAVLRVWPK